MNIHKSVYDKSVASLRRKFADPRQADVAVAAFSEGWTVIPDPVDASAPGQGAPDAPAPRSARQSEYDDLLWQAKLTGKDAAEADRLARNELARRHGEAVDPEDMSVPELWDHLATLPSPFDPDAGQDDIRTDPRTIEELTADLAAQLEERQNANKFVPDGQDAMYERIAARNAQELADKRQAYATKEGVSLEQAARVIK